MELEEVNLHSCEGLPDVDSSFTSIGGGDHPLSHRTGNEAHASLLLAWSVRLGEFGGYFFIFSPPVR